MPMLKMVTHIFNKKIPALKSLSKQNQKSKRAIIENYIPLKMENLVSCNKIYIKESIFTRSFQKNSKYLLNHGHSHQLLVVCHGTDLSHHREDNASGSRIAQSVEHLPCKREVPGWRPGLTAHFSYPVICMVCKKIQSRDHPSPSIKSQVSMHIHAVSNLRLYTITLSTPYFHLDITEIIMDSSKMVMDKSV